MKKKKRNPKMVRLLEKYRGLHCEKSDIKRMTSLKTYRTDVAELHLLSNCLNVYTFIYTNRKEMAAEQGR